ncbi:shikimate dehydrogenase family protein [Marinomonas sp. 2405UD66-6]|uniref:shikimate dehydrogenase family protein n=1 Tax=Marinomonas sp. 2405UD66-6 TaxID=3391834 RepID=UPI0039C9514E
MKITGKSKLLAIIGDPIFQVKTPIMANERLAELGCLGQYVLMPMEVHSSDLIRCVEGLRKIKNFSGAVITMPHKKAIVPLLDDIMPEAEIVGAVNTVFYHANGRLQGTILDGEGFVHGLINEGYTVSGSHCVLADAGGAASAIAFSLLKQGCDRLYVQNRTQAKAIELVKRLKRTFPEKNIQAYVPDNQMFDIAINGTKLGMSEEDDLPFSESIIQRSNLIAECVLAPDMTKLLMTAKASGKQIHKGKHMLQAQLDLMLRFMGVDL